jgi:hypothetical protein
VSMGFVKVHWPGIPLPLFLVFGQNAVEGRVPSTTLSPTSAIRKATTPYDFAQTFTAALQGPYMRRKMRQVLVPLSAQPHHIRQ